MDTTISRLLIRSPILICVMASLGYSLFTVEPVMIRNFGSVYYDLDVSEPIDELSNTPDFFSAEAYGRSLLTYPLDVYLIGLNLKKEYGSQSYSKYFYVSLWGNLTQPKKPMVDKDWAGVRISQGLSNSELFVLFSDTDSRSDMMWFGASIGKGWQGFNLKGRAFSLGWDVSGEYYNMKIFGLKGWQGDKLFGSIADSTFIVFDTLQNTKVLTYKAIYLSPGAFATINYKKGRFAAWDFELRLSPFTLAWDEDYHLLRGKKSNTWAAGLDGELTSEITFKPDSRVALILRAGVQYAHTWGSMKQEYYADTPESTLGQQELDEYGRIYNKLGRFTYNINLGIPIRL